MFKNRKIIFLISLLLFIFFVASAVAHEDHPLPPSMKGFLKDMQRQIKNWISKLEEIEKDPYLPLAKRAVIKAIKEILIKVNRLLDELLPPKPRIKKASSLALEFTTDLRYGVPFYSQSPLIV